MGLHGVVDKIDGCCIMRAWIPDVARPSATSQQRPRATAPRITNGCFEEQTLMFRSSDEGLASRSRPLPVSLPGVTPLHATAERGIARCTTSVFDTGDRSRVRLVTEHGRERGGSAKSMDATASFQVGATARLTTSASRNTEILSRSRSANEGQGTLRQTATCGTVSARGTCSSTGLSWSRCLAGRSFPPRRCTTRTATNSTIVPRISNCGWAITGAVLRRLTVRPVPVSSPSVDLH